MINFKKLLLNDDSHQRIALSFSIGVFVAFSPTLGFHLLTVIILAWLLKLNKVAIITGALINNPWTIIPIYSSSLWLGLNIYEVETMKQPIDWSNIFLDLKELDFSSLFWVYSQLKPYFISLLIGSTLLGIIASFISYFLISYFVVRFRKDINII